ncbi:hypothetical protein M2347_000495 [Chryseobacterium sp. H1D6B]|nr:hypothetical protein [Chryseobacterium sp. H1D6B]
MNFTYKIYNHMMKKINSLYGIQDLINTENNIIFLLNSIHISIWHDFSNG